MKQLTEVVGTKKVKLSGTEFDWPAEVARDDFLLIEPYRVSGSANDTDIICACGYCKSNIPKKVFPDFTVVYGLYCAVRGGELMASTYCSPQCIAKFLEAFTSETSKIYQSRFINNTEEK